jgi:hypothetical protein
MDFYDVIDWILARSDQQWSRVCMTCLDKE